MARISQAEIDRYATGPSAARVTAVKKLHAGIRAALDHDSSFYYETFLQGSYRNDTAIADINDVDIVALRKYRESPQPASEWEAEFQGVAGTLRYSSRVGGSVSLGDKCVKVAGPINADVVPALAVGSWETDPITIYSRRQRSERPNYPRRHYDNGVKKQRWTSNAYKPTVRLFKRWARQYPAMRAPSFYIECAVHSVQSKHFYEYLPLSFFGVGVELCGYTSSTYISSVAGDKDILTAAEWKPAEFAGFQRRLLSDLKYVSDALDATTHTEAHRLWRLAFGD